MGFVLYFPDFPKRRRTWKTQTTHTAGRERARTRTHHTVARSRSVGILTNNNNVGCTDTQKRTRGERLRQTDRLEQLAAGIVVRWRKLFFFSYTKRPDRFLDGVLPTTGRHRFHRPLRTTRRAYPPPARPPARPPTRRTATTGFHGSFSLFYPHTYTCCARVTTKGIKIIVKKKKTRV